MPESGAKQKDLQRMVQLARDLKAELQKNNIAAFGEIIHEGWELKRSITGEISSGEIDGMVRRRAQGWRDRRQVAGRG